MVPRVAGKGRSFKGAGLYYLHDKQALTAERVAFTQTLNLPTDNAEKAMGWMAHTAMRQSEIKRAAGGVAKGRKLRDPVYAYSLSWHPDEEPTREQMVAAAMETLKRLDLEGHEALLVAHNDEPHPHIHVIVNRVNPETGIAAPLSNDHLKLSAWAEAYEKEHGKILCAQRVINNERRKQQQFVKDRASQKEAEFRRWRKERAEADLKRRQQESLTLSDTHRRARDQLKADRDRLLDDRRGRLKERHKPTWRALFHAQRDETRAFENAQKTVFGRLRYWLKNREIDRFGGSQLDRQGMLSRAFQIVVNSDHMRKALAARQEADRKKLAAFVREDTRRNVEGVYKAHDRALARLKQRQGLESADQRERHSRESQEAARRVKAGGDRAAFDFEKAQEAEPELSDTFNEASRDDRPAREPEKESGGGKPKEDPTQSPQEGQAERIIREARQRGLDETQGEREKDRTETGSASSGGLRGAFKNLRGAFQSALQRKEPIASPEHQPEGRAARAFKDAAERTKPPSGKAAPEQQPEGQAARAFREARERPEQPQPTPDPAPAPGPSQPARSPEELKAGQAFDAFREAQAQEGEPQHPRRRRFRSFTEDRERENDRDQDVGRERSRGPEGPPGGGGKQG